MSALAAWALGIVLRHFGVPFLRGALESFIRRSAVAFSDNPGLWELVSAASAAAELRHPTKGLGAARYELVADAARAWLAEMGRDLSDVSRGTLDDMIQLAWAQTQALVDDGSRELLQRVAAELGRVPTPVLELMERPLMRDPFTGEYRVARPAASVARPG